MSPDNHFDTRSPMSRSLTTSNIAAVFDALDVTADDFLSVEDFTTRAGKVCAALAGGEPAQQEAIRNGYLAWWRQVEKHADLDNDGQVSRQEFIRATESGMSTDPQYLTTVLQLIDALFDAADTDGDDQVDRREFARIYHASELGTEVSDVAFDHLDTDNDGVISRSEFHSGVRALFTSPDPDEPGTWVMGRTTTHV
jgi:Ca2+-binding EF-hand superfamily protein